MNFSISVVLFVVFIGLFAWYHWKRRQNDMHNATQLAIYNRIAQQMTDALSAEDLSWNEYVIIMNGLRETHNESLKGSNTDQYKLPPMTTLNSMGKEYDSGTNRRVFEPPRRNIPIRKHKNSQGENNA